MRIMNYNRNALFIYYIYLLYFIIYSRNEFIFMFNKARTSEIFCLLQFSRNSKEIDGSFVIIR